MNPVIFDIETDGFNPTKIHCMAWKEASSDQVYYTDSYDDMRRVVTHEPLLCGHNIQRFDIPILERILGVRITAHLIDTLALSWYLFPDRIKHGLHDWGEDVGIHKPPIEDWENLDIVEYFNRCSEDVKINSKVWDRELEKLGKLYDNEQDIKRLLGYLEFKMDCVRHQEQLGWKLDVDRVKGLLGKLEDEKLSKIGQLRLVMPKVPIVKTMHKPAKMYKKSGELSAVGKRWKLLNPDEDQTVATVVTGEKCGNPNSHVQIKDWLFKLGWKPDVFSFNRDKVTNEIKKTPQVQQDKSAGPGLSASVKSLFYKCPDLELIDGLAILSHRISILKGFLENVDDKGYIKAQIGGFTNTLRFKHRTIVNLPSVDRDYGSSIRSCLIAPDGYELAGSDMASLEDRTKQHYIYEYDPEYVEEMCVPDWDPHLDLALSVGAVSPEDAKIYKDVGDEQVKSIRHLYKQGNYACQYGAKPKRIALTLGCTLKVAKEIYDAYWKRNWAINEVADNQHVIVVDGSHWLYNPVSRFYYSLRCPKDAFSTLNQGTGVYCFDTYLRQIRKLGIPIIGQFHDEWIAVIHEGKRDQMRRCVNDAIKKTNEILKLNRELGVDLQFGGDYSHIH